MRVPDPAVRQKSYSRLSALTPAHIGTYALARLGGGRYGSGSASSRGWGGGYLFLPGALPELPGESGRLDVWPLFFFPSGFASHRPLWLNNRWHHRGLHGPNRGDRLTTSGQSGWTVKEIRQRPDEKTGPIWAGQPPQAVAHIGCGLRGSLQRFGEFL